MDKSDIAALRRAAKLMREDADAIFSGCTILGDWDDDDAKNAHDVRTRTAMRMDLIADRFQAQISGERPPR